MNLVGVVDFWGAAVPAWVGAIGGVFSAFVAAWALVTSLRAKGGVRGIQDGLNDAQPRSTERRAELNLTAGGTLTAEGHVGSAREDAPAAAYSSDVAWAVERLGKRWILRNQSRTTAATIVAVEDIAGQGDFHFLPQLPILLAPGAFAPFVLERTFASPAVTPIRIRWTEEDGRRLLSFTFYI